MKGAYLFSLVLLIVLAIPLFADHTLVNTVGEFSAISIINSEEVSFTDQELIDNNVPVLDVGINKRYLRYLIESKQSVLIGKTEKPNNTNLRGARRIKSGRY